MKKRTTVLLTVTILFSFLFLFSSTSASTVTKTLYSWVKDAAGNISNSLSDSVDITLPSEPPNTYYVSYSQGLDTNNGTSSSTPWKTIAKVNSQTFTPGASILFKKGDTWTGETITVNSSGNSTSPITYSSYGTGNQPVISGFTTITGWTNEGNGIYSKTISPESAPNMVTVNDVNTAMGRWPNADATNGGYLTFESHSTNTSITDNELTFLTSNNWTGATAVIRMNRYIISRNLIASQSGNTINYTSSNTFYDAIDGYGYFIQNDLKTLDQTGEWYYNYSTGKFYMYFGGNNPTSYTVKVSTTNENISSSAKSYITISGLDLEGSNTTAIRIAAITAASHTTIENCNINNSGLDGIKADGGTSYITINNSQINNTNNYAISMIGWAGVATTGVITNNQITNTGIIAGMGSNDGGGTNSIYVSLDNSLIEHNIVNKTGFNGIKFIGERSNITVRDNFITDSCSIKDDCAGIYVGTKSYNNHPTHYIENNIVLNSIGNHDGVSSAHTSVVSHGIYLDDSTENTEVLNNTVANNTGGGFFLGYANKNNILTGNISYNNKYQLWSLRSSGVVDPNDIITGNVFFSNSLSKYLIFIDNSNPTLLGTLDNNYYERPLNDDNVFWMSYPNYHYENLASWKINYNQDLNSHSSPVTITDPNDILFDYNATQSNKTVSLGSNTYVDVTGATHTGSVTLLPYTSIILIKTN